MDTSTRYPTVAATTIASAHIGSRNLSTNPKRMAVIKAWVLLKKIDQELRFVGQLVWMILTKAQTRFKSI